MNLSSTVGQGKLARDPGSKTAGEGKLGGCLTPGNEVTVVLCGHKTCCNHGIV